MITDQLPTGSSIPELRKYRFDLIKRLSEWLKENESMVVDGSDWTAVANLPQWCLLDTTDVKKLAEVIGALYYSEAIKQIIQGDILRRVHEQIGKELLAELLRISQPGINGYPVVEPDNLPMQILEAGLCVLECTIEKVEFRNVFMQQFDVCRSKSVITEISSLSPDTVMYLYRSASDHLASLDAGSTVFEGRGSDANSVSNLTVHEK